MSSLHVCFFCTFLSLIHGYIQLDGTIMAPTNTKAWGSGLYQWLDFTKLRGITIQGSGIVEGQGSVWWNHAESEDPAKGWKDWDLGDPVREALSLSLSLTFPAMTSLFPWQFRQARVELSSKMPSLKPTVITIITSI